MSPRRTAARRSARALRKVSKLAVVGRRPEYRAALRHGIAAATEHERVPFAEDFRSVVDVGAGRGQFALVARRRFPQAEVHCFEPVPEAREKLALVARGFAGVRIYAVALGSRAATTEMHVSGDLDSSSLLPKTSSHLRAFPGTEELELVTVPVARLDEVLTAHELPSPSLIKIDAQGYELEVLRGASGLLQGFRTALVECSFMELYTGQALADDVVSHMRQQGFRMAGIFSPAYDADGRCLQADVLFERPTAESG